MSRHPAPRIAIVGAGPGGLTLARILYLRGIHAAVFERETFSSVRPQGGSLDMHADSGQFAIQNAELSEEFKRIARYEDQEGRVYDKHGNLLLIDDDVTEKNRPEVDRGQLRQMMLDSVPEGTVHWDHELSAIQHQDDGTFDLAFRSGATERFSLIVGADGAWSRVRPLVSAMVAETRPRRMQNKLLLFLRECRAGLLQCIKAQQININSVPTRLLIDRS